MSANGEGADEADGDEAPREVADGPQMTDILLADSGQVATDAGGGLSGGNEVRGPVTGPEVPEASATLTWKNDEPSKPDPRPEDLAPRMRDVVGSMRTDVPKLDDANVNSGTRKPRASHDPHAEGRAIDVNRINGISVRELKTSTAPEAERAREAAGNLEQWARQERNVNQFIGPNGG